MPEPGTDESTDGRLLERAIALAVEKHAGQSDKSGAPYILHPLRMMTRMKTAEAMMTAVLHDIVEDTDTSLDDLRREGFPESVVSAVDALSRRDTESYEEFATRAGTVPLARQVKIADLEDNMNLLRLGKDGLSEKDVDRLNRYLRAWSRLTKADDA
ncbi:MAG: HD domain-containing protein [Armatimonadota bacterium]